MNIHISYKRSYYRRMNLLALHFISRKMCLTSFFSRILMHILCFKQNIFIWVCLSVPLIEPQTQSHNSQLRICKHIGNYFQFAAILMIFRLVINPTFNVQLAEEGIRNLISHVERCLEYKRFSSYMCSWICFLYITRNVCNRHKVLTGLYTINLCRVEWFVGEWILMKSCWM